MQLAYLTLPKPVSGKRMGSSVTIFADDLYTTLRPSTYPSGNIRWSEASGAAKSSRAGTFSYNFDLSI
jgi:hypothetical protein